MQSIQNKNIYLQRMSAAISDKSFFVHPLAASLRKNNEKIDRMIDYGCADAALIKELSTLPGLFSDISYTGYDINPDMLKEAKRNMPSAFFTNNWNDISYTPDTTILNLSSVIHEVYSYGTEEDVKIFWDRVFGNNFKYIIIRDMMVSLNALRPVSPLVMQKLLSKSPPNLQSFEEVWGDIRSQRDLINYLLKYRYTENWNREVQENYLPLFYEELLKKLPKDYEIVFQDHFTLPYIKEKVQEDFGICLDDPTHIKLILRKI